MDGSTDYGTRHHCLGLAEAKISESSSVAGIKLRKKEVEILNSLHTKPSKLYVVKSLKF